MTRQIIRTSDAPGSSLFSQAVKAGSTVYLSDMARPSDFAGLNEEYVKFLPNYPPARAVAKLGVEIPNVLVSIKMTAVL